MNFEIVIDAYWRKYDTVSNPVFYCCSFLTKIIVRLSLVNQALNKA